ncbi:MULTISPECIES: ADP-ribosyltransferase [unclassified Helicobacter]|uniref:ADP-ribosyltransferase n=1 Tax=unclassified Helicobacter TaxID=2593540 RepID=UPI000CF09EB4|nr:MULTISPECIES: ADP-ribosyltransferase [unclassified Helicobacter]
MKKLFCVILILILHTFCFSKDFMEFETTGYKKFYNGNEAINWWSNLYSGLKLSEEERATIYSYTYGNFVIINNKLRSGDPLFSLNEDQKKMVAILDKALSKTIIFEDTLTYRYEDLSFLSRLLGQDVVFTHIYKNGKILDSAKSYLDSLKNKRYQDYGFMSTTLIKNSVFQHRIIELVIKVPKYSLAMFVSIKGLAAFPSQYELLFPRDRILTIEDYKISEDRKKISILVAMDGPCYLGKPCEIKKVDNLRQPPKENKF